jgi:hypothetical protein
LYFRTNFKTKYVSFSFKYGTSSFIVAATLVLSAFDLNDICKIGNLQKLKFKAKKKNFSRQNISRQNISRQNISRQKYY